MKHLMSCVRENNTLGKYAPLLTNLRARILKCSNDLFGAFMGRANKTMSLWPVRKITGIPMPASANRDWRSSPMIPGNLMSKIAHAGVSGGLQFSNSLAESKSLTCSPMEEIRLAHRTPAVRGRAASRLGHTKDQVCPCDRIRGVSR
jgi:hypothetical protein